MTEAHPAAPRMGAVRVWDLPVRLTHWLIAVLVAACWASATYDFMTLHRLTGYSLLALVVFRILWGFFGSTTARFVQFVRGPNTVIRYLRDVFHHTRQPHAIGHNPLGGWNVVALLLLLLGQSITGLFSVDEFGVESGPLAKYLSFDAARYIEDWHRVLFNLLLVLIAAHVAAVLAHFILKRENLVVPMLTGRKHVAGDRIIPLRFEGLWQATVYAAVSIVVVSVLVNVL